MLSASMLQLGPVQCSPYVAVFKLDKTLQRKILPQKWFGAVHNVRHAIFGQFCPLPQSHFVTHPGTPPESTSHISDPPIFSRPSTKNPDKSPLYKISLNCSLRFLSGRFVRGSLVRKVLSGRFLSIPHSVRIHLLQQKVKHHFKFQVS